MSIFKQRLSKKTKIQLIVVGAVILVALALIICDIIFKGPLTQLLTNKDDVESAIRSLGFFGPLLFIFIQILQTVIAPIPGNVSGVVGGFLFGWWGVLWTLIGSTIGFWLVFLLSRKFGRKLVEKIIKKESLDKFDYLTEERGSFVFFLIFLIPGLPDDIVGYIAGLTAIPIKTLLVLAVVGRLPATIATNMFGSGLGEESVVPVVVVTVVSAMILALVAIKRNAIMGYLKSSSPKPKK